MLILLGLFIFGVAIEKFIARKYKNIADINRIFQLLFSFLFALSVYAVFTQHEHSMISISGDAADIWKTIVSFHTDDVYGSYVLYKGINSVYPYVWFYDLSQLLGVNEWFFIKLFYAGAFAYISAIGFPNMIELLVQRETKLYRRCFCIILMWYFWCYSGAFTQLMVDLPCLMYYVLLINAALKLYRGKKKVLRYIWLGIMSGLCMTASGQYTMPAVCIVIFALWVTFSDIKGWKNRIVTLFSRFVPLLLCMFLVVSLNNLFEASVVDPLREEGAWIPSGDVWLHAGLVRFRENYRYGGATPIPSYRNASILEDYYGESLAGINGITVSDYLRIFFKYPLDFVFNYLNSFFLILSPDHGSFNLFPLLGFYTLLYCSLYIGTTKCKTWKKFFSPIFLIGFSFLWATVPMLVMNIEERTCMQIQGLIIALALCDGTIWDNVCEVIMKVRKIGFRETLKSMGKISYPVIFYLLFICICMTHISTLYEAIGSGPQDILINIK